MGYRFSVADVAYLRSGTGVSALAEVGRLGLTAGSLVGDLERVRREHGERAAALVETVRLRRRAGAKLARPGSGCSPTTLCSRRRRVRSRGIGPGGWRAGTSTT